MKRIYFSHGFYGCWTGCCGYDVTVIDENGKEKTRFEFGHNTKAARRDVDQEAARIGAIVDEEKCAEGAKAIDACWEG